MRLRERVARLLGIRPERVAFLGLGANVGDRLDTLRSALADLDTDAHTSVEALSGIYETEPVLTEDADEQDPYLNLVACVTTGHAPRELLETVQRIEAAHGRDREREGRWGARTLDIDILLYDDEIVDEPDLQIPHPRLTERAFALVPLAEILPPGAELPDGSALSVHLARLAPITGVELFVRLVEGPGTDSELLHRRPPGPPGGAPRLGERQGGPGLQGPARRHVERRRHGNADT